MSASSPSNPARNGLNLDRIRKKWSGQTVVCIASGPSLTKEDCELVRDAGLRTVVVNTSFRLALWADALYAMDAAWWSFYGPEAFQSFTGEFWSHVRVERCYPTKGLLYPQGFGNSGSYAISLAIVAGASRVLLLGYDCKVNGEKRHWHADHPKKMGNANSIGRWPYHFELIAKYAQSRNVKVVNCSRDTALSCFQKNSLEEELGCFYQETSSGNLATSTELGQSSL